MTAVTSSRSTREPIRPVGIEGSGRQATKSVDVKDFNAIQIERLFQADVTRADSFQVRLTADDNILERIEAVREGPTLHIRLAPGSYRLRREAARVDHPADPRGTRRLRSRPGDDPGLRFGPALPRPASGASTPGGIDPGRGRRLRHQRRQHIEAAGIGPRSSTLASGASKLELADWQVNGEKSRSTSSGASSARLRGSAQAAVLRASGRQPSQPGRSDP